MALIQSALLFFSIYWFYITISVCIAIILYVWGIAPYRRSTVVAAVGDLPGPTPLPFIGHLLDVIKCKGQVHVFFDEYYKKYGRLFTMFVFSKKPVVMIADPEMLKDIFVKEFQCFHDRPSPFELPKPFNDMISIAKGEPWHRIRTILSPNFSALKLKLTIPMMNKSCDLLKDKLDLVSKSGETIDIYKFFQGLTMEVILGTFFGIESNAQNDYNDPAFKAGRESLDPGPIRTLARTLISIIPFGSYLMRYFPSLFIGNFHNLFHLAEKIIASRRQEGHGQRKDFMDLMLSHTDNQSVQEDRRLSEIEVIAQSMIFMFAGYETTSDSLGMTCYHLITNPDVQEKLQREIDEVWSDEDQPPSYDTVQSLPYLDMIISETLRLYPPGYVMTRECTNDCVVKGLPIKRGTPITVSPYTVHRDPEFYPDPEKFDPERFSAEGKQSRDPFTYLPFGHGPRNCIGMRFAQMEEKLALVRILKKFSFVVAPETEIPPSLTARATLICRDGVKVRVKTVHAKET